MNYSKKTVYDADVKGKKVLVRCDFNVPQDKKTGEITSDKRIVAAIPTLKYLLEQGAAVIACSHLGKPVATFSSYVKKQVEKGKNAEDITEEEWKKSLKKLTLAPVAKRLSELLGTEVIFAADTVGEDAKAKASALKPGEIMLLENLRFDARETKNGEDFAKALADMADVYVSDAFGTVHRAHASTAGVAAFLPAYAGLLVEKEISIMGKALDDPKRPFVAVLGGAKVSDKINVINNLLEKADTVIIGGGMAYTFKKAQGYSIGKSLLEADKLDYAKEMLAKAEAKGVNFLLPDDNFCASEFSADAEPVLVEGDIPDDLMGMDIGPKTVEKFAAAVKGAGTIVWNGPMGVFEFDKFANGTKAMAQALADSGAVTIVGGGDSAAAVEKLGYADRITHISTGGGASLEFLEGKELPGVACLLDK
ncbi:MAG: phosphoglycerate kinase [Oscillospiraceae bacterium]|nr:phosphoglycerate kinase [Oscillospiraceae bacterium]